MVGDRTVGELVVVAGNAPPLGGAFVVVDDAVAIRVAQSRELGALHRQQGTVVPRQPERLVQAGRDPPIADSHGIARIGVGMLEQPDFAAAQRDRHSTIRQPRDARDLELHSGGRRVGHDLVV